jgi:hypothetical protein
MKRNSCGACGGGGDIDDAEGCHHVIGAVMDSAEHS